MGTRNLTIIINKEGKRKVAQYGQWDGYPSGQGAKILSSLKLHSPNSIDKKINRLRWGNKTDIDNCENTLNWHSVYPHLSRDCGGAILHEIMKENSIVDWLVDKYSFARDSLFCEWAYVVDLKKGTFEVYEGFNVSPLEKGERFRKLKVEEDAKYYQVRHLKTYKLDNLPTVEDFIKELEDENEDN